MADWLELAGGTLIVVGIALYAFPLALIVTGLFLVVAAWSLPPITTGEVRQPAGRQRTGR